MSIFLLIFENYSKLWCHATARGFKATITASDFSVLLTRIINYLISDTTHVQQSAERVKSFCPQQGYTFKQHYPSLAAGEYMT